MLFQLPDDVVTIARSGTETKTSNATCLAEITHSWRITQVLEIYLIIFHISALRETFFFRNGNVINCLHYSSCKEKLIKEKYFINPFLIFRQIFCLNELIYFIQLMIHSGTLMQWLQFRIGIILKHKHLIKQIKFTKPTNCYR